VRLFRRNGHDWTGRFPLIARAALSLKAWVATDVAESMLRALEESLRAVERGSRRR
jgi:ATP-dependent DNA ligase